MSARTSLSGGGDAAEASEAGGAPPRALSREVALRRCMGAVRARTSAVGPRGVRGRGVLVAIQRLRYSRTCCEGESIIEESFPNKDPSRIRPASELSALITSSEDIGGGK